MQSLIKELRHAFEAHADSNRAQGMKAYMRNQFDYSGIPSPTRKEILKPFIRNYSWKGEEDFIDLLRFLWTLPQREFKYIALDFSFRFEKKLNPTSIPFFESLIAKESWWDTVDGIAPHVIGNIVKRNINLREQLCDKWINSENFWYQRSAIILQLKFRSQTDFDLLKALILRRADSKEFFVQKASGWALRQYSRINPNAVKQFIDENKIPSLAAREGMRLILKSE